jgi:hypothetical protein
VVWVAGLIAAWAWTTPFQGFPDEIDHYVRSASIGAGELVGRAGETPPTDAVQTCCHPSGWRLTWVRKGARRVELPADVAPSRLPCRHVLDTGTGCRTDRLVPGGRWQTTMGTIEPGGYLPAAAATTLASSQVAAVRLARLAGGAAALALLALAGVATWRITRSSVALAGLFLAITPMTLFVASSSSPNATEVAGAVAFLTGCLAASHPRAARSRRSVVALVVLGGVALNVSRSLGPVWLAVLGVTALVLGDRRRLVDRIRRYRPEAAVGAAVLALSALSTAAWEKTVQPRPHFSFSFFTSQLGAATGDAWRVLHEIVGRFGLADVSMPAAVYWGWWALLAAAVGAALVVGTRRAGVVLAVIMVAAAFELVGAGVLRQNGFALQGRHILAVVVAPPIVAGWSMAASAPRRRVHGAAVVALAWVVLTNAVGWWANVTSYRLRVGALRTAPYGTGHDGLWGNAVLWYGVVGLATAAGLLLVFVAARYGAGTPMLNAKPTSALR